MKHLSASSLSLYADCSLKFKFHYIDKIYKPISSIHLVYGSAIHKALEHLNISLLSEKEGLEDVFQEFHNIWNKEIKKNDIRQGFYSDKLYKMGINTLEKFYYNNLDYEILAIEQKFDVPIIYEDGKQEKYTLYGLIDAIIKRKNNIIIVDYKTSKERYEKFKIDTSLQLEIYSYAFRWMIENGFIDVGKKKKENFISYCVLLKDYDNLNGDIKIQKRKVDGYEKLLKTIKTTVKGIENEIFIPNYNSMCKYCDYKKECLEWNK